jgi:hypothetical protein
MLYWLPCSENTSANVLPIMRATESGARESNVTVLYKIICTCKRGAGRDAEGSEMNVNKHWVVYKKIHFTLFTKLLQS